VGGAETQEVMAAAIPESTLHVYPDLGHAAYEEAKDFHDIVLRFFRGQTQAQEGGRRERERRPVA
jgi:pimeloyl-ACP methyl ester carboxylesterase